MKRFLCLSILCRSQDRTLECSICQLLVPVPAKGIEAFPLNFFINNMLTVLAVQNPTKCTNCEDSSQATARCLDCVENLCTNCVFAHKRIRQTIDHRILSFDEIQANEVKDIIRCPSFCSVHPREVRHQFFIRDPKQQRRRQLRKRHFKSEVLLLHTLSRLFHLVQFTKCWEFSLELNSKRLYRSSGKGKESRCLVFTYSIKREIWHFHVVVVQWLQRNVQSCCFANPETYCFFCRSRWRRRRRYSSSVILYLGHPSQFLREKPWGQVWKTYCSRY